MTQSIIQVIAGSVTHAMNVEVEPRTGVLASSRRSSILAPQPHSLINPSYSLIIQVIKKLKLSCSNYSNLLFETGLTMKLMG